MMESPGKQILLAVALTAFLAGCASHEEKNPTDPAAQVALGEKYSSGTWRVSKNDETSALWYGKAAMQGDPEGEYRLGLCYSHGQGVPKNDQIAFNWFSKAAKEGNAGAQFELGKCYELGDGVDADLTKAYLWYNMAAATGNEDARENRDALARRLTESQIHSAQRQSEECWKKIRE